FPGLDLHPTKPYAIIHTLLGFRNPAHEGAETFLNAIKEQLGNITPKHVTIFGHSLGAGSAIHTLAHCLSDERFKHLNPHAVLLEGWQEEAAARDVCHGKKDKLADLVKHIDSIRVLQPTFVNLGGMAIGEHLHFVMPTLEATQEQNKIKQILN